MAEDGALELENPRYAVTRKLGEGGQAATFEAVDKKDGKLVVLKRFRVRGAKSWKEVELAEREAHVLASIDHPLLPRYVEHFEERGELFLVTEKIEGESLAELRASGTRFSPRDVERLLADAAKALDYLHGRSPPIIHRDLKPSNVIRRPDGSFAFIDFGAVRDRMKPEGGSTVVGTFGYMAPEQFQGRAMPASDVYAIASTVLVLLTGAEPEDLPHKGLAIDVERALAGTRASPSLVRALGAMLEPDPDKRAPSIAPLLASIRGDKERPSAPGASSVGASWAVRGSWTEREADRKQRARDARTRERDAREERRALKAERKAIRRAARAERRALRGSRGPRAFPWFVTLAVTLGLTMAEVAVAIATRVTVPIVLSLLSVIFGRKMRDAAHAVSEAGTRATEQIRRTREIIRRGVEPEAQPPEIAVRFVETGEPREDPRRARVGDDEDEDEDEAWEEAREAEERARDEARKRR